MSWEWSHANEAYAYAEEKLQEFPLETLTEIAGEWKVKLNDDAETAYERAHEFDEADEIAEPFILPCKIEFADMDKCALASWIWEQASSWEHGRRCSNGGHEIWLCPDGCHTVDLGDMPEDWTPSDY